MCLCLNLYIMQVHVVLSLLPPSVHAIIAKACVEPVTSFSTITFLSLCDHFSNEVERCVPLSIELLDSASHVLVSNRVSFSITFQFQLQHKKHMVTASYVEATMSSLDERARTAGITILCEMGLDPGIGNI
ncbi:hypothetical protein GW17_00019252 [Ensete ventricosum]|nr:hypothetical protein GW17_00019252 [Ensete ventricosum]RZR85631.1 hypothetical protein BHM03_00012649 [Ensete ventricosum]